MSIIPAPELPARKTYKHPFIKRVGTALAYAVGMACFTVFMGYMLIIPGATGFMNMVLVMSGFGFASAFVLTYWLDSTQPNQTMEEIWFRKRLEEARGRDRRVAQLNYDYDLLDRAANDLYETLGREEFIKQIKDPQIVEHAIEMARLGFKQEKINEDWAVTEH